MMAAGAPGTIARAARAGRAAGAESAGAFVHPLNRAVAFFAFYLVAPLHGDQRLKFVSTFFAFIFI